MNEKQKFQDADWKKRLSPEEHRILREKGTETPFSGKYVHHEKDGLYTCAACGNALFSSVAKFDSGTGWPSFDKPVSPDSVEYRTDKNLGMVRIEIICARCGGHLGHVFDDGPPSTGKRFCTNSVALNFKKR